MKPIQRSLILAFALNLACLSPLLAQDGAIPAAAEQSTTPKVQIAILLDTSSSMDGLIAQAKSQLWNIVNEFIAAKRNGVAPEVHVALYEYGKSSLSRESHWIRQIQQFTRDLDAISRDLFALTTNGGDEYCGAVVKRAVDELGWDAKDDTYKAVFIAGNEPYNQGPVDAEKSSLLAMRKRIFVNTIHCGDESSGRSTGWQQGAVLADGKFFAIDQNHVAITIDAPQDPEILKLNTELNTTYLPFGAQGQAGCLNQSAQDGNALAAGDRGGAVSRAMTKASGNYCNWGWDAVDAVMHKKLDITTLKSEELPASMKGLKPEERVAFVEKFAAHRKDIQAKILKLTKEREIWLVAKRKELSQGPDTLETAVQKAVREQAAKMGFAWQR